ncbi:hypothetical protein VRRI112168_00185 [Vreelandella rituensis]|uniref:Uncharacterized protein n=1 Tax=Vreelandella rituensis TaxID=2282306 RepID=A0A368UDK6_9GAMM|nr:hypothetical protein [Halomonas rituensis]RCV93883.1 hypothetical protein DU506_01620 [Halomonas rituensis]
MIVKDYVVMENHENQHGIVSNTTLPKGNLSFVGQYDGNLYIKDESNRVIEFKGLSEPIKTPLFMMDFPAGKLQFRQVD